MLRGIVLALALGAAPAHAGQLSLLGAGKGVPSTAYAGPGDVVSGAFAWYGLRAYSKAVADTGTQKSVRLRRASDSTEADILILTTGAVDTAAASTFCNATTCFVTTWYDQSGNARNAVQTTAANQPAFIFSCLGANPCVQFTSNVQSLNAGSQTVAGVHSYSFVANRSSGTGQVYWFLDSALNYLGSASASANQWVFVSATGGSGTITAVATDAVWHAGAAVGNGASSVLTIDGTDTTGTVTISTGAGNIVTAAGLPGSTGNLVEVGVWASTTFSASNRTALNSQQHAYWGF